MQTITAIRLNNPVYGQHLIMEISQYTVKKSLVCSPHFTPSLQCVFVRTTFV